MKTLNPYENTGHQITTTSGNANRTTRMTTLDSDSRARSRQKILSRSTMQYGEGEVSRLGASLNHPQVLNTEAGEGVPELPQVSFDTNEFHDINHLDGVAGGDDTLPLPMDPDEDDQSKVYNLRKKLAFRTIEKPR